MEQGNSSKSELKYETIKKNILSLISSQLLKPNDKIPGENEIARRFGVSVITARKALSDLVNEGFIYRIKGKGSFVSLPNSPVQEKRLRMIVFLLPASEAVDSSFMKMIRGVQAGCSSHGYSVLIEGSNDRLESEQDIMKKVINDRISGVIVYSIDPEKNVASFNLLKEKKIPFVLIDRYTELIPYNIVSSHNTAGGFQAAEHLIQLGHRKIAFAAYDYNINTEQLRHKGYQMALKAFGIEEDKNLFEMSAMENAAALYQKVKNRKITGIVCANDECALKLMDCFLRWGLRIPEDVSITGYDGIEATEYVRPTLTTVVQDFYQIGKAAGELLVDALEHNPCSIKQILMPTKLLSRESTAAPAINAVSPLTEGTA